MKLSALPIRIRISLLVGVATASAVIVPIASSSAKTKSKAKTKPAVTVIDVRDDVFSDAKLTIKEGQTIKWVWSKQNFDSHNVTLLKGPKGVSVSKFTSQTGVSGVKFERVFLTPGTYHFQCSVHPESMNTVLTVKK